jgi:hypothetical protein
LVIPAPTPGSSSEGFLHPATDVGYPVAAVGVKHKLLLSGGRVFLLSVTIGTKQAREQEVLFPFVGGRQGREKSRNERGGQASQHCSSSAPPDKGRSSSHRVLARHFFYTGWRAYKAAAFCGCRGCLRRRSYAYWRGWCAPTGGVGYSVASSLVDHIRCPLSAVRLPDPAPSREVPFPCITGVASSSMGVSASLNCSIYC